MVWFTGEVSVLSVSTDTTTAFNQASIGIGMSGSGTLAVQAQPNMTFFHTAFFSMNATINEDGTWTVTQGLD
ncbi:hypothetical protein [Dyadobacter diqingensis]|uniref:hypothetical protein n=1 Tax=Dyadobacter diqingensis TaxID=2938121 RepID=UPI0020C194B4|nr:hypothetical protein [Dyadobacter diqingensis]